MNRLVNRAQLAQRAELVRQQYNMELLRHDTERQRTINLLIWFSLIVVMVLLLCIGYISRRKALMRQRMLEMDQDRMDSELHRRRLENELLRLRQSQMEQQLHQTVSDNVELSARLALQEEGTDGVTSLTVMENNLAVRHPHFAQQARRLYPRLTDNDVRLLGLMKLGYDSREIASALNISVQSLATTRYRLRKKLALPEGEDLKDVIERLG